MTTTARTRAARVTQPSLTHVTAATARTPAASGCRAIIRISQPSSRASFAGQDDAERGPVDRRPPAGHRERVRVVQLGQLLAGHDPAHSLVTSFVHTGENPGAAGGTSSSRPASHLRCHHAARPDSPGSAAVAGSLAASFSSSAAYRFTASASRRPNRTSSSVTSPRPGLVIVMSAGPSWMVRIGAASCVGAAADAGAGGQPDVGLDLGRAVRAEPDCAEVAVMPSPPARRAAAPGPPAPARRSSSASACGGQRVRDRHVRQRGQAPVPAFHRHRVRPRLGRELAGEVHVPGLDLLRQGEADQGARRRR